MLGNLIAPSTGMKIVRAAIENELKFKVPVYTMVYNAIEQTIKFEIPVNGETRTYPYDHDKARKLCKLVESLVKKQVNSGDKIDVLRLEHNKDVLTANIYFRDSNDNKKHLKKQL